ncbi:MAG: hypothetical protein U1F83_18350 [Verrucomicrobiota bacterium]
MAFLTHEDTTNDMAETFIEEFMRMGYGHKQVLALFRNPYYLGPHMALEKRGEPFIRHATHRRGLARWGKAITWSDSCGRGGSNSPAAPESQSLVTSAATVEMDSAATDPMGAPIPKLNL